MDILDIIIKLASFLTAIGIIIASLKKIINNTISPINETVKQIDKNQCQNYLVNFLANIENDVPMKEYQYERAWDIYDHYIKLGGNSYIKDKWEKLVRRKS